MFNLPLQDLSVGLSAVQFHTLQPHLMLNLFLTLFNSIHLTTCLRLSLLIYLVFRKLGFRKILLFPPNNSLAVQKLQTDLGDLWSFKEK